MAIEPRLPVDLPRVRLEMQPDPRDLPHLRGPTFPQLPFVVLVIADAIARPDPRAIEERHAMCVSGNGFDKAMAACRLSVEVALPLPGAPRVALRFHTLSDLKPRELAQQIAQLASVDVPAAEATLPAVFADPRVATIERVWGGLRLLADYAGEHAEVELLNASVEDLDADFDDAPALEKSGLWRIIHQYNHLGMRPVGVVVLADDLGAQARRLRDISAIARAGHLAVLADAGSGASFRDAHAWRQTEDARFVGLVRERGVVAPAHAHRPRVEVSGVFPAAALLLQSHARALSACYFAADDAVLPGVEIVAATPPEAASGFVTLASGARASRDETCHAGGDHSLATLMLGNRILHETLNVQWRRGLGHETPIPELLAATNEGLARRLAKTGIEATVATAGAELELSIRLPAGGATPILRRRLPLPKAW